MSTETIRKVMGIVPGVDAQDGAGVKLKRSLGGPRLQLFDPFLLLDEFRSDQAGDYIAGFPDHTRTVASRRSPTCWPGECAIATIRAIQACCCPAGRSG